MNIGIDKRTSQTDNGRRYNDEPIGTVHWFMYLVRDHSLFTVLGTGPLIIYNTWYRTNHYLQHLVQGPFFTYST